MTVPSATGLFVPYVRMVPEIFSAAGAVAGITGPQPRAEGAPSRVDIGAVGSWKHAAPRYEIFLPVVASG